MDKTEEIIDNDDVIIEDKYEIMERKLNILYQHHAELCKRVNENQIKLNELHEIVNSTKNCKSTILRCVNIICFTAMVCYPMYLYFGKK